MVVRTSYIIDFYDVAHSAYIMSFEFNTLMEVKQFMKKTNGANIDGTDYSVKLKKREYTWTLSTGAITVVDTPITADF